ncbi:alpha/beta hydrolase, partial [Chloroflexota bacterium]
LKAVIDYVYALPEVDQSRLSLLGFSAGAAVAIYVAARDKRVSSVISCACPAQFDFSGRFDTPEALIDHFRSIGIIRDKGFPGSIDEWLDNFQRVEPIEYVSQITPRPLLLVHGSQDEVVDVSHAHELYAKAGEPKQLIIIDGAGHGLRQNDRTIAIVLKWLKSEAYPKESEGKKLSG